MLTNQEVSLYHPEENTCFSEPVRNDDYGSAKATPLAPLTDTHGRVFDYVRIAVTETCNLRCTYCMPEEGIDFAKGENVLSTKEILRIIEVLASMGVKKVRFTGGEPLMRKDIVKLVEGAASTKGIQSVHITTNGIIFPKYAQQLKDAGLTGVNISLDTLNEDRFQEITRRPGLDKVLDSIALASSLNFERVKVNNVVMRGFNADELQLFCNLTKEQNVTVRFIEFMPFDADQMWESGSQYLSAENMIRQLVGFYPNISETFGTRTEHHIFQVPGWAGKIAVIPAFTRSLCSNCSRIRITSDGGIRNCLYSDHEFSLMTILRAGCGNKDIEKKFRTAFMAKAVNGFEARKQSVKREQTVNFVGRNSMTMIGG